MAIYGKLHIVFVRLTGRMGHTTRGHDPARTRARVAHPLATPVCHELLKSSARCVFVVFNELSLLLPPRAALPSSVRLCVSQPISLFFRRETHALSINDDAM